ncbi:MAG: Multidrug export protein EmrB [Syntrophorhabdus sp. PtaU1.Bin002]|nr:MAG: Multidrug export protein EmrB [Syntrophorhabdus sp. PtaB.Bin006]OPY73922.1 MAG: Multidrug export protein EmrB [Syntrophorhabdus sp. PtaU1.Bin002]
MNKWIVAITVMLPTLIEIIDMSVVNVSLDHIRGSLSAGIDESTWSITMYLVSNAIIIPITGWLSRFFGRKLYLNFSIALFTASSLMCGLAWNIQSLIVFRVFQGIGGGALQPISQSILLETFPPRQHGVAMAFFGTGIMFGPIIGPMLGGWITDNWSWHWIFFINIPIGIISMIMTTIVIRDPHYMKKVKMKMDYWGLILIALGLGCLQVLLDQGQREDWFSSPMITWLTIISAASLLLFPVVEFYTKEPVINLKVFRSIPFSTGNLIMFFAFFNLFGSIVLLPIYLQTLMGYTATLAGLVLGPGGFASILALTIAGRLINKVNPKGLLTFGLVTCAFSTYLMSQFSLAADFATVMWPRIVLGLGMGFIFIPLTNLTLSAIRKEEMGNATALFNLIRNLGGSFGVAFVSTVLARKAQLHQSDLISRLTPFDMPYQIGVEKLKAFLHYRGFVDALTGTGADGAIYKDLVRQATMISFNDTFLFLSLMLVAVVPLVLLLRRPDHREPIGPVH